MSGRDVGRRWSVRPCRFSRTDDCQGGPITIRKRSVGSNSRLLKLIPPGTLSLTSCGESSSSPSLIAKLPCRICLQRASSVRMLLQRGHSSDGLRENEIQIPREPTGRTFIFSQVGRARGARTVLISDSCVMLNPEFSGAPILKEFLFS